MSRSSPAGAGPIATILDIGSSKIACLIAQLPEQSQTGGLAVPGADILARARVLGIGYQTSQGFRAGRIADRQVLERDIRQAVDKAERLAGFSIDEVHLSFDTGGLRSQNHGAMSELAGGRVRASHVDALMREGWDQVAQSSEAILHALPLGFALDGATGIPDPTGFSGQRLFADFHVVSTELEPVRALLGCVEDCYLSPVSVYAAPYGSALSLARPAELHEGVAVLDLGGGASSMAVFTDQRFVYADAIAKGGVMVTSALAKRFALPWRDAELLKLHIGRKNEANTNYPQGRDLIERHYSEIFTLLRQRLEESGFAFNAIKYVVLSGGGALYHDAPRLAAELFGKPTRRGSLAALAGVPSQLTQAPFSSLWGGLVWQQRREQELSACFAGGLAGHAQGSLGRFGHWLGGLGS